MVRPLTILTKERLERCLNEPPEFLVDRAYRLMLLMNVNCSAATERDALWQTFDDCLSARERPAQRHLVRLFLESQHARRVCGPKGHPVAYIKLYAEMERLLDLPKNYFADRIRGKNAAGGRPFSDTEAG
jgi:hypothetical protein